MNISKKEKIISAVIAFVVIAIIGVGVYAVIDATRTGSIDNDNRVNLNELAADDVAIKDVSDENNTSDGSEKSDENVNANIIPNTDISENTVDDVNDTESEDNTEEPFEDVNADVRYNYLSRCSFSENDTLRWPVRGKVILQYSMDSTIYFKTLGVYKTNPAISIAAEEGTNVGVVADGVVQSVKNSEETGTTVVVGIGDGYEVTYGMLKDVVVREGDIVVEEQLLGKVAAPTEYYAKEGSNVYFKMTKDGEPINPMDYLEE